MGTSWPIPKIEYLPFYELSESRDVAFLYSKAALDSVSPRLNLPIVWRGEVLEATQAHWDTLTEEIKGEIIYAVGGGLAVDAAKYIAAKNSLPLISLPTAITVDAFFTWASGIRQGGCVHYLETCIPDAVIIDMEILQSAPVTLRAAGICDVLSIATGCWDWVYAEEKHMNTDETKLIPYVFQNAQSILQGALDCAQAAGAGDPQGLKQLIDCLALEVQLCNLVGHSRPEEGSEHFFAYSIENEMGKGLPHGDLVGPGIIYMATLQGQDVEPLKAALRECNIPLNRIPNDLVRKTLLNLPTYCQTHKLPFGIAHTLNESMVNELF